jgi:hypothetical protein
VPAITVYCVTRLLALQVNCAARKRAVSTDASTAAVRFAAPERVTEKAVLVVLVFRAAVTDTLPPSQELPMLRE